MIKGDGIVTRLQAWSDSWQMPQIFLSSKVTRPALGPTSLECSGCRNVVPWLKVAGHLIVAPRLRASGAVTPLAHTPLCCAQRHLCLYHVQEGGPV